MSSEEPAGLRAGPRAWAICLGVVAFAWGLRAFISVITPGNPNPYITPLAGVTTLLVLGFLAVRTARFGRSRLADTTVVLGSLLLVSGAALQLGPRGGDLRRAMMLAHMLVGLAAILPAHLYLLAHTAETLRRRPVVLLPSGLAALGLLLLCAWTGTIIVVLQAREMEPLVPLHRWGGWLLLGALLLHARRGVALIRARSSELGSARRLAWLTAGPAAALLGGGALCGVLLPDRGAFEEPAGPLEPALLTITAARTSHGELMDPGPENWAPATCSSPTGYCHIDNVAQWQRSAHGRATHPVYDAVVRRFEADAPGQGAHCAGCHDPAAVLAPPRPDRPPEERGVGCIACHSAVPGGIPRGNASYVITPYSADFVRTAALPAISFPMILADLDRHRAEFADPAVGSTPLCAACHVVRIPEALHSTMPGQVLVDVVTPWEESRFAGDGPEARSCIDCHMPRIYGPIDPTITRSHVFLSGNTGVPWLLGDAEHLAENQAFLRSGFVTLDARCGPLEAAAGIDGSPSATSDPSLRRWPCTLRVENTGSAHDFPSALRHIAQIWIEARILDAQGEVLWSAGVPSEDGSVADAPLDFLKELRDAEGRPLHGGEFWRAASVSGPAGIPPGGALVVPMSVDLDPEAAPSKLVARLLHRRWNAAFVREILGPDSPPAPLTELARAEVELLAGAGPAPPTGAWPEAPTEPARRPRE